MRILSLNHFGNFRSFYFTDFNIQKRYVVLTEIIIKCLLPVRKAFKAYFLAFLVKIVFYIDLNVLDISYLIIANKNIHKYSRLPF